MPRLGNRPPRDRRLLLSFTAEEIAIVRARAVAAHMPVARYIREVTLGYAPKPKRHAVNAEAIRTLAELGTTLKAIAADARGAELVTVPAAAEEAIERILTIIGNLT
jgi:hypothetical protein